MARRQSLNDTAILKPALEIAALVGGAYGVYKLHGFLSKLKDSADLKRDQDSTIKPKKGGKLFDLTGKPITSMNLATIAADLNDALSFPVDQGRVLRVFQSTPFGYVAELEKIFLDKNFGNLRQRMVDKLSDTNWIKVKFNFR
jgi:hypothetical protein